MRRSFLLPLAAMFLAAGCDDAAAPEGRAGDVTARVYVDRDASASFTSADSALAGVTVNLTSEGQTVASAQTGADGTVTFSEVEPGSYQLSVSGTVPDGTALVTNPTPAAVVSFQGSDVSVDFRYVFFPGSISGRIYRNDNGEAGFQEGEDTPGAGLWVYLRRSVNGAAGDTVAAVRTDAGGVYSFTLLAPGSYFLEFEQPTTIDYVGEQIVPVAVQAAQATSGEELNPMFTGSLVQTIAEARAQPNGALVAVEGFITVPPNIFTFSGGATSEIWLQDNTGGIAVFSVPSTSPFQLGDRVQVTGTRGEFNFQKQIANPNLTVSALAGNDTIEPKAITVPQALTREDDGELVRINNLTIASVPGGTGASFTLVAISSAGDTIRITVGGANTGLTRASFVVGQRYDVTGILTAGSSNSAPQVRLKPRYATDVQPGQPITPIATARGLAVGTQVTVVGNVTAPTGAFTSSSGVNSEIWVQDATGGLAVFPVPTTANIALGDVVEVTGTIQSNAGQIQIGNFTSLPAVTRLRAGTAPAPVVVTGTQVNDPGAIEGQLVTVTTFTVSALPGGTSSNFNVNGVTADGQTIQLRVIGPIPEAQNTGLIRDDFPAGRVMSVTGILSRFNATEQIKPRSRDDITVITP